MTATLTHWVNSLGGPVVYVLLGAIAFAEAAIFLGFVLPGETALLLGGYLAYQGRISLTWMVVVGVLCAIAGDSVGYELGRHFGPRLKTTRLGRRISADRWRSGESYVRRLGGKAVFLGRFTALLRALVPTLAGMSGIHYPRFLAFNAAGALIWGAGCVLIGYLVGSSIDKVGHYLSVGSTALLAVVVVAAVVVHLIRRRRAS